MSIPITRVGPVGKLLAELTHVPAERIQHWVIVVQYDTGVAMIHTLCCEAHAREGLALVAATPPDLPDMGDYSGSN